MMRNLLPADAPGEKAEDNDPEHLFKTASAADAMKILKKGR